MIKVSESQYKKRWKFQVLYVNLKNCFKTLPIAPLILLAGSPQISDVTLTEGRIQHS